MHSPGDHLVVHVEEQFALTVFVHGIIFLPPEREVHVPVAVMRVHADVLSEIRYTLLRIVHGAREFHGDYCWCL